MNKYKESVVRALLPQIILQEVARQPIHGYGLISLMRRKFGVYFGASTVYPLLSALEKQGLIKCEHLIYGGRLRKVYSITLLGRQRLQDLACAFSEVYRCVEVRVGVEQSSRSYV